MIIKLEGKARRKGVSKKTGNEYDFGVLYFLAPQRGVEGMVGVEKLVDPDVVDFEKLLVGQYYDVSTDLNGQIDRMVPAKT